VLMGRKGNTESIRGRVVHMVARLKTVPQGAQLF
jgi:hypothetical protein